MNRKISKQNLGITLVALVVTIVVLLILAGISLSLILGSNGIITRSNEARTNWANASAEEQAMLNDLSDQIDGYTGKSGSGGGGSATVTLAEAKAVDMLTKTSNSELQLTDGTVTIPAGYMVTADSADTKAGGVVISDAATNGNEWVWVPVEHATDLYSTDNAPVSITGGSGNTYVSGVTASKYSKSAIISGITRVLPNDISDYREPDVVVGDDGIEYDGDATNRNTAGFTNKTIS